VIFEFAIKTAPITEKYRKGAITMDELKMKLSTKFMRNLLAGYISRVLYKKLGYEIGVDIEEVSIETVDGKVKVHLNVDAQVNNEEFMRIVKRLI
jgi:ribosomal protein S17E